MVIIVYTLLHTGLCVTNAAAAGDGDGNGGDDKTGKKQQN
jgi:hypothetical protein